MESGSRAPMSKVHSLSITHDEGVETSSTNPEPPVIRKALTSESFVEKVALLLLTALLSGLIVPLVISSLQATRTRSEAILQAQAKLLEDVSETILTYETLALDVSWFKTKTAQNEDLHQKAFAKYSERVVDLVAKWRAQAARAQTLVSPAVSAKIDGFLWSIFPPARPPAFPDGPSRGPRPRRTLQSSASPLLLCLSRPRLAAPRRAARRCGRPSRRAGDAASAAGDNGRRRRRTAGAAG